jgi:hypothetical protein
MQKHDFISGWGSAYISEDQTLYSTWPLPVQYYTTTVHSIMHCPVGCIVPAAVCASDPALPLHRKHFFKQALPLAQHLPRMVAP